MLIQFSHQLSHFASPLQICRHKPGMHVSSWVAVFYGVMLQSWVFPDVSKERVTFTFKGSRYVKMKATRSFRTSGGVASRSPRRRRRCKTSELAFLTFLLRVTYPALLIQLDYISEVRKLFHSSLCNFFRPPVSSSFLHPNTRLSRPFYSF